MYGWIALRAGPLEMFFDPAWAFLRRIRLGEREVLRGIYAPVRDAGWGTVPPRVSNLSVEKGADSFRLSFDVECRRGDIDFAWQGAVAGEANGTVRFTFKGTARSTFLRQRIGFCVLHPIAECAGHSCTIEHTDGTHEAASFPLMISPHQPFFNLRAITHRVADGVAAEVRCEGDTFETEDQRNWTDASFKTYCTPLALPRPVEVKAGTVIEQAITLTLKGTPPKGATGTSAASPQLAGLRLDADERRTQPLPSLGLCVASHGRSLSPREIARLKALSLSHLRVELAPAEPGWRELLARAVAEAKAIGAGLEIALLLSERAEDELRAVSDAADALQPRVVRWLVFPAGERAVTPPGLVPRARRHLSGAPIGGGSNRYFTELNRDRPQARELDLIAYSFNPQVHTFDEASMVESLDGQRWTVLSAAKFVEGRPLALGPITLRPRPRRPPEGDTTGELPPNVDPRQATLFAAGWTLASIATLAAQGVGSLTYYETTGWLGVMEADRGSPLPERFPSEAGGVFPVYHIFAALGEFAGGEVAATASDAPLLLAGLLVRKAGRTRLLVANLTDETLEVQVGPLPPLTTLHRLDESNAAAACRAPEVFRTKVGKILTNPHGPKGTWTLKLPPYGLARLDARS